MEIKFIYIFIFWEVYLFHCAIASSLEPGAVDGCNGYPCSPGTAELPQNRSLSEAVILSKCFSICLKMVSYATTALKKTNYY